MHHRVLVAVTRCHSATCLLLLVADLRVQQPEGEPRRHVAMRPGQERQQPHFEVSDERPEPARGGAGGDPGQLLEQDAAALAGDVGGGLPQVDGLEAGLGPEPQEPGSQAEGGADPVQPLGGTLAQCREQRGEVGARLEFLLREAPVLVLHFLHLGAGLRDVAVLRRVRLRQVRHLALVVVHQQLEGAGAVSGALHPRVCGDAHNPEAAERGELSVLVLLADGPWDEVALRRVALGEGRLGRLLRDSPLQRHLNDAENLGELVGGLVDGCEEHKEAVGGRVAHQLQVVGRVLVVRGHVQRHHALKEELGGLVVGEQGVAIDGEELALRRVREGLGHRGHVLRRVQAQQPVEPLLDGIVGCVADGLGQLHLLEQAPAWRLAGGGAELSTLLAQLLDEFEGQRAAGALVAVDGGAQEDQVRAQQLLHQRKRDRSRLVYHEQLRLRDALVVLRLHVLDGLAMVPEHIHAHNRLSERGIVGLHQVVVDVLLVVQRVQPLEHKLKQRVQILRARRCHEDVRVPHGDGPCNGGTQSGRLPAATRGGKRHRTAQSFLGCRIKEGDHGLGLIDGAASGDQRPRGDGVRQGFDQLLQLLLALLR
mmetsp:Transcript_4402/g.7494  ORF Transcript_4402/g.7494 Transcript_4402/m.7494 type:complete len:595 (-) Transcript_4402:853-2637(-)